MEYEREPSQCAEAGAPVTRTLYGRRSGKPLTARRRDLVGATLPNLSLDLTMKIDPSAFADGGVTRLWLEIGFGAGEHLVDAAARNPDTGVIGCEPFLNGMAQALARIAEADLGNVRLHLGDAGEVVDRLPDGALDRVFLFYPDPWPKRRQRKRRFLDDAMLARLARVTRRGAELRLATDIDDMSGWMLARLLRSSHFEWRAAHPADWQRPWEPWLGTRYERKARAQGRRPCYLTAVRL